MSRYDRWVSATSRTLDILALIFLADVTLNWFTTPGPPWWQPNLDIIAWTIWLAFAVDYIVRLLPSPDHSDDGGSDRLRSMLRRRTGPHRPSTPKPNDLQTKPNRLGQFGPILTNGVRSGECHPLPR
jgi:hypothetical protein